MQMANFLYRYFKGINAKERKVILANFLSLSTLQAITYVLPIIVLPYVIRAIGPEKFGLVSFAQAFVQYFLILTDYGFSLSATRELSLCRQDKSEVSRIFSTVMTVKIILAALSFCVLWLVVSTVPRFKQDWLVYVYSFGIVIGQTLFPVWFFQGTERMKYIAVINIAAGITFASLVFIFVRGASDYLLIPLFYSAVSIVSGITAFYIVCRKMDVSFAFQRYAQVSDQLRSGWNVFSSIVAINAYTASRVFAVGLLTNNTLTGYYSIAERIATVIQQFPLLSFTQAIYPRLSHIFSRDRKRALKIMHKAQHLATNTAVLCIPLIFFLVPWIVKLVCGTAYEEVIFSLRLLLFGVIFIAANALRIQFLLVSGQTRLYARLHIAMAVAGVPLIFFAINMLSFIGAALATMLIEGGMFYLTAKQVRRINSEYLY
jgi:PST family polysaccharide transporter